MKEREALGLLELSSIIRGYRVLDAMVKRSPVKVILSHPLSKGKFLIVIHGDPAEVEEALDKGVEESEHSLLGEVYLPQAHKALWKGIEGRLDRKAIDALGLVESASLADVIKGVDAALKATDVQLVQLHLGQGIDGRGYFVISGTQSDVEASVEAAVVQMRAQYLLEQWIIEKPHDDMTQALLGLETIHAKY